MNKKSEINNKNKKKGKKKWKNKQQQIKMFIVIGKKK